jgi:PhzF family phenazine biosynthesis protein
MAQKIYVVDAFTDQPFKGNPAGVCILQQPAVADWMQKFAAEMNHAETAFLVPQADGFQLRWFTPAVEVDLCGHATLASAFVLWSEGYLPQDRQARFHTKSGLLTADRRGDWIDLDFPSEPAKPIQMPPSELANGLGVPLKFVGQNRMDYLVEVDNEDILRSVRPKCDILTRLSVRGVIVTAKASTPGYDFVSRFFAPAAGVPEDPVTGSAHCCLGPYWHRLLHKTELRGLQVSARSGVVEVGILGDRVSLSGQAVLVLRGELLG